MLSDFALKNTLQNMPAHMPKTNEMRNIFEKFSKCFDMHWFYLLDLLFGI